MMFFSLFTSAVKHSTSVRCCFRALSCCQSESNNITQQCLTVFFSILWYRGMLGRQHYRLYTIQSIPSLKVLDHQRITQTERDRAKRLASSAAGAALESDIQDEAGRQNTFTPGEGATAEESFVVNFTAEEKEKIRKMVANADSPEEIEEIERSVQRGVLPKQMSKD